MVHRRAPRHAAVVNGQVLNQEVPRQDLNLTPSISTSISTLH